MLKTSTYKITRILISILAIYILIVALYFFFQRQVVFKPVQEEIVPAVTDLTKVEIVNLKTKDGQEISSWFYLPKPGVNTIILYLHGNSGNIGNRERFMINYIKSGYGVFLLEYRGYGNNSGSPSEEGLYNDARAAVKFLGSQGFKPENIVVVGESLGTAITTKIASENDFKAVVLQSPFTSMADVGRGKYPFIPVDLLLKDRFESINRIDSIKSPILFIHGDKDELIPISHMEKLYAKSSSSLKKKKIYKNYGHNNLPQYSGVVMDFIEEVKNKDN